jgi:hypothetical protein
MLKDVRDLAKRRLADVQARYKKNFDRTIRGKNKELGFGSWVFVRRELHDLGVNPKLEDQSDGPFRVLGSDGDVFILQKVVDQVRVSADRVTPAPPPTPMPSTPLQAPPPEPAEYSESPRLPMSKFLMTRLRKVERNMSSRRSSVPESGRMERPNTE